MSERAFAELAGRLGLESVGYRAEGAALGTTVTLMETSAPDRTPAISISCPLVRPMDLRVSMAIGASTPRAKTAEHKSLGSPDLDAWVTVWGAGDPTRAAALLEPELIAAMRSIGEHAGLIISDLHVTALVAATTSVGVQQRVLDGLVDLRGKIHAATRLVPVAPSLSPALPSFQRYAAELGVDATTCPFGLFGVVDGCVIDVFRFLPMSREDNVLLVHVAYPTPLAGDWLLNSHLGRSLRARFKSVFRTLTDLGPRPGWFGFSTRFKATRGSLKEVHAALGDLGAMASLATSDRAFLNISSEKIITGVRIRDLTRPPDVAAVVRELVTAANRIHGAAPESIKPGGAPYR